MAFRIAIASTDGKVVNQHFGRAERFYIVEVNDETGWHFIETRKTQPVCNTRSHDDNQLRLTADLLADCDYVLVSQIGKGAEFALHRKDITAFSIALPIDRAVEKLVAYRKRRS
ncbi:MAG: dinitrogenase iron-molybdenum cofactor biosynthesis protein [Oscillospiraceae bacterium]|nr:dinitrogenase iron-molybdenum cofactor biosynthesis protein [Oscillospiraceae bacterium]